MSALNALPGGVPVVAAVGPLVGTEGLAGPAVDLIESDGECFAIQTVGAFEEGATWAGRIEQSDDQLSWAPVPGGAFGELTAGESVRVVRFARTARYLRYTADATGSPYLTLAVLVGQPRKSY
ncbi:MAG: hypothetical protein K2V38_15025 [Gemmataceae bacterium]|nr:hypothetical protein [Gemmataceae bacterium]